MESGVLGIVFGSSVRIAVERCRIALSQAIETVQRTIGDVPIALCSVTVAEIGHGDWANAPETRSRRRKLLNDLKATFPIHQ